MSEKTNFFFNGQEYYTKHTITLQKLLNYFSYDSTLFILEYNNFICNQKEWDKIKIKKYDRIEIISIVGGG